MLTYPEANAVARIDNLQFLEDVIPRTTTFKEYRLNKAAKSKKTPQGPEALQNGQTTLDSSRSLPRRSVEIAGSQRDHDAGNVSDGTVEETAPQDTQTGPSRPNGTSGLVFEHYEPNGTAKQDQSGDVEMS